MPAHKDRDLLAEIAALQLRLREAEETILAIQSGDVDALVVGSEIYTLDSAGAATNRLRQDVLAQMQDAVLACDGEDRVIFMNQAAERQYRLSASQALGHHRKELFTETWRDAQAHKASQMAMQEGGVFRGHSIHRRLDGSQMHVDSTVSPLQMAANDPTGHLYVIRDITERIEAEQSLHAAALELARRERQFSTLVENSPDIFARLDRAFRHIYVSPIVEHYTGQSAHAYIGKTNAELGMPPGLLQRWQAALSEVFKTGNVGRIKYEFTSVHGQACTFDSRLIPEFDDHGQVESVLSIAVDITEQEVVNAALHDADRKKDEFLATLAHELRNPLAPISNALQIMRLSEEPKAHDNARNIIERQLGQMVHLVDDLLDVSRISQGKVELRREEADLSVVLQTAIETSRPLIQAGKHELAIKLPPPGVVLIDGDVTRLCQIVANLLNNAAKYTPQGGRIEVFGECQNGQAVITVQDSGIGIPPELLPRVFDMFAQVDRTLDRSQGGLGIGLALVKRLVEMHGGTVEGHSAGTNQGSRFTVRFPLSRAKHSLHSYADHVPSLTKQYHDVRVLVVDDNIDSASSLAQVFEMLGYETAMAHDGAQALEVAQTFRPRVVVLDIGLPRLSGHEVAQHLRREPWGRELLLIALSGWGQEEDRRRSKEAGFDHHFVKPVDLANLIDAVDRKKAP